MIPAAVLFSGGLTLGLPGDMRVFVMHGVYLDNALLILYLAGVVVSGRLPRLMVKGPGFKYARLIAILALVSLLSALVNIHLDADLGKVGRLLLLAAQTLAVIYWTRRRGDTFVLRWYLLGMAVGGAINIVVSLTDPYLTIGALPVLYSRNAAGGFLAIASILSAWLMLLRRGPLDLVVSILSGIISLTAAAMSFSKTAMLIGFCGLVAQSIVVAAMLGSRGGRKLALITVTAVLSLTVYVRSSAEGTEYWNSVQQSINFKFVGLTTTEPGSVAARYMYFWAVTEILTANPILGVSPAGFYRAVIDTRAYHSGLMEPEEDSDTGAANPHNSFLYYASATGIPGLLLVCVLLVRGSLAFRHALRPFRVTGALVALFLSLGYFIYGTALPSLFNTPVLYVPAGVAFVLAAGRRQAGSPMQDELPGSVEQKAVQGGNIPRRNER